MRSKTVTLATNYVALREHSPQFLILTNLLPAEIDELLTDFVLSWKRRNHSLDGAVR